jgi:hypothetical protein
LLDGYTCTSIDEYEELVRELEEINKKT